MAILDFAHLISNLLSYFRLEIVQQMKSTLKIRASQNHEQHSGRLKKPHFFKSNFILKLNKFLNIKTPSFMSIILFTDTRSK
jgi:hypothetical protein